MVNPINFITCLGSRKKCIYQYKKRRKKHSYVLACAQSTSPTNHGLLAKLECMDELSNYLPLEEISGKKKLSFSFL